MKNIFYSLSFYFFMSNFFLISMDNPAAKSLEKIISIPVMARSVAYLKDNCVLAVQEDLRTIDLFRIYLSDNCYKYEKESTSRMELGVCLGVEKDRFGKNVHLGRHIDYSESTLCEFFYNHEKRTIIQSPPSKQYYAGLCNKRSDCYLIRENKDTVKIKTIMDNHTQIDEYLSLFLKKHDTMDLCYFLSQTNVAICSVRGLSNDHIYAYSIENSHDRGQSLGCPREYQLSDGGRFFLAYDKESAYWKELIAPYKCTHKHNNGTVLGIGIIPRIPVALVVTHKNITFWDMKTGVCIYSVNKENPQSPGADFISISPDRDFFSILSKEKCVVYKIPSLIRDYCARYHALHGKFALVSLFIQSFLVKDVGQLLIEKIDELQKASW